MLDENGLRRMLAGCDQEHLLAFWGELSPDQREELAGDIDTINFEDFARVSSMRGDDMEGPDPSSFEAPDALPDEPTPSLRATYEEADELGRRMIHDNRVAALVVAGGDATRLGYDGPKGMFPIGPVSEKSLFQLFAEAIGATNERFGCDVRWYVMTSVSNHDATVTFFQQHDHFGLNRESVLFFRQGMMPVADCSGKIILRLKHRVALAPTGHGGCLTALAETGMLRDMTDHGVDCISYFQVDNPLIQPIDPRFVGLHAKYRSEMSSLTIRKASDDEKVGHFVAIDGKVHVVEYTVMPPSLTTLRTESGERKFDFANTAAHVMDRAFVERLVAGDLSLPWHLASKQVPYIDVETGQHMTPDSANAIKAEMFVFDALPPAERAMVLLAKRSERFSPVKNADGVDSNETARRDMVRRAASWLDSCGVRVPRRSDGEPDCVLEISPRYALDAEQLRARESGDRTIERGDRLYLE